VRVRGVFVLVVLLWIGLTCAQPPAPEDAALGPPSALLVVASEAALARLAPDAAEAGAPPVSFPVTVGPALRALRATGRGDDVAVLEAALDRAARLALADAKPAIARGVESFTPEDDENLGAGALAASFQTVFEPELRAALQPTAEQRLGEAGAPAALEGVRNAARSLPLPRDVSLDLVSVVTERAADRFFNALADEAEQLHQERVARERVGGREAP
jgi:hypothetical protein